MALETTLEATSALQANTVNQDQQQQPVQRVRSEFTQPDFHPLPKQYQMTAVKQAGKSDPRKRAPPSPGPVEPDTLRISVQDISSAQCIVGFTKRPSEFEAMPLEEWDQLKKNVGMIGSNNPGQEWMLHTAKKDGRVVGTLLFSAVQRGYAIAHTFVPPAGRKLGTGSALVRSVQARVKTITITLQDCVKTAADFYCIMCNFTPRCVAATSLDGPLMLVWEPEDGVELDPVGNRPGRVAYLNKIDSGFRILMAGIAAKSQPQQGLATSEEDEYASKQPVRSHRTLKRTAQKSPPASPAAVFREALSKPKVSNDSLDDSADIIRLSLDFDQPVPSDTAPARGSLDELTESPIITQVDSSISELDVSEDEVAPAPTKKIKMRPPLPADDVLIKHHIQFLNMPCDTAGPGSEIGWSAVERAQARVDTWNSLVKDCPLRVIPPERAMDALVANGDRAFDMIMKMHTSPDGPIADDVDLSPMADMEGDTAMWRKMVKARVMLMSSKNPLDAPDYNDNQTLKKMQALQWGQNAAQNESAGEGTVGPQ